MFELARESPVPLVDQIVERLSRLIQDGQLLAGTCLPSIRKLAVQVGASAFTVVDAYDRLVARLARSRGPHLWAKCPPQGLRELRETLSAKLQQQGIAAGVDNLMTTVGASQAFDLLCRSLLAPGDAVLVEDPGYFVLFEQLRAQHLRLIRVPRRANGPDLDALEEACRAHRPRAFFIQTLLHNPSGTSMDATRAHRLLSLAEQFGFTIIEDDIYGDLYEGPAVRVGFVATHPALTAELVQRKVLAMLSASTLPEAIVAAILDGGRYRRHVERVRARLARMRADSQRSLSRAGVRFDDDDSAGMFLWGEVPPATDMDQLVRDARGRAILLAKGALFSPDKTKVPRLRFNVAHSAAPELTQFLTEALAPALS